VASGWDSGEFGDSDEGEVNMWRVVRVQRKRIPLTKWLPKRSVAVFVRDTVSRAFKENRYEVERRKR